MSDGCILVQSGGWWKSGDSTNANLASTKPDVATKPSGANILDFGSGSDRPHMVPATILISPFGKDTAAETFLLRIWGWAEMYSSAPTEDLRRQWHPTLLAGFTCTLGTSAGLAGSVLDATHLYATTIVVKTNEGTTQSYEIITPGSNMIASIALQTKGFPILEFETGLNSSSVSAGVLVKPY